jgi:hypothetical protein
VNTWESLLESQEEQSAERDPVSQLTHNVYSLLNRTRLRK